MAQPSLNAEIVKRIDAAHDRYVTALRRWNALRCGRATGGTDHAARASEAHRHVKEALAEWIMLFEHETGRKLNFDAA
jgi:hypothetical protein